MFRTRKQKEKSLEVAAIKQATIKLREQKENYLHLLDRKDKKINSLEEQRDALIDLACVMANKMDEAGLDMALVRSKIKELRQVIGHAEVL